jgi:4'-phosphopantetheinyl transferase
MTALCLEPATVDVWWVTLTAADATVDALRGLLDDAERARADRHRTRALARAFVLARGLLRSALASYLGRPPQLITFSHGANGKPFVPECDLGFNVSHSEDVAMMAFAAGAEVGVDVERIREFSDWLEIARESFRSEEYAELSATPEPRRVEAFFRWWTKKEAYLKATGDGLSAPLNGFGVRIHAAASPVATDAPHAAWLLFEASADAQYAAAVAIEARRWRVRRRRFPSVERALECCGIVPAAGIPARSRAQGGCDDDLSSTGHGTTDGPATAGGVVGRVRYA